VRLPDGLAVAADVEALEEHDLDGIGDPAEAVDREIAATRWR
jgi:hypothetical protein